MVALRLHQKGISLLELMLVLAVIALMLMAAMRYYTVVSMNANVNTAEKTVRTVIAGAERWAIAHENSFADITNIDDLTDQGYISNKVTKNIWGGGVQAVGLSKEELKITFSTMPSKACYGLGVRLGLDKTYLDTKCKLPANETSVSLDYCYPSGICSKP